MRIIGGIYRGRRLKSPKGMETRPTQDRVRETIFNVLQNYGLYDKQVLDLFAGTGAMGLEAISRGAREVVALDRKTAKLIKDNATLCHVDDKVTLLGGAFESVIGTLQGRTFDLIFSDPPYNRGYMEKTIHSLESLQLISPEGLIVLECDKQEQFAVPSNWLLLKEQIFGYTKVLYYRYKAIEEEL